MENDERSAASPLFLSSRVTNGHLLREISKNNDRGTQRPVGTSTQCVRQSVSQSVGRSVWMDRWMNQRMNETCTPWLDLLFLVHVHTWANVHWSIHMSFSTSWPLIIIGLTVTMTHDSMTRKRDPQLVATFSNYFHMKCLARVRLYLWLKLGRLIKEQVARFGRKRGWSHKWIARRGSSWAKNRLNIRVIHNLETNETCQWQEWQLDEREKEKEKKRKSLVFKSCLDKIIVKYNPLMTCLDNGHIVPLIWTTANMHHHSEKTIEGIHLRCIIRLHQKTWSSMSGP